MLQIASGKFFKTDKRYRYDAKSILYSNLSPTRPLKSCIGSLELDSVHNLGSTSGLIFSYINQIERMGDQVRAGEVVRVGDDEIVDSFRCLSVVGLGAYFSREKDQVNKACHDRRTPIPILQKRINLTDEMASSFEIFSKKVIALPRKDFIIIDRCAKQFTHAIEVIDENIDLAYSMFVYCLEALAQSYGEESNNWEDYDPSAKDKLEVIFESLDAHSTESIKKTLLEAGHNKLKRRFISFITTNLSDDFFLEESPRAGLAASDLFHALSNLYNSRSGFVHNLTPVQEHIRHNLFEGDSFRWDNKIYLTLNGVVRLVRHIILQTIANLPAIESEDFNWRLCLPGIVQMKMAAKYWVADGESFTADQSKKRLIGFLENFDEALFSGKPILDIRPLLEKIEQVFERATSLHKRSMITIYALAYSVARKSLELDSKEKFLERNISILNECSTEAMIYNLFSSSPNRWTANECAKQLEEYFKQKHAKDALVLPRRMQVALMIHVANLFYKDNHIDEYKKRISSARLELSGNALLQGRLLAALNSNALVNIYETMNESNETGQEL